MGSIDFWRTASLFTVALGQTFFVLLYVTFPWYKTFLGRALFYKSLILGTLVDLFVAARYFDFGGMDELFVIVYCLLGIGVWWQLAAFARVRWSKNQNSTNPGHGGKPNKPEPFAEAFPETHERF